MAPVLVVDDDYSIRETVRLLLDDAGYEVVEAEDGSVALQILRSSARPMVVLLDLMMPHVSGYEVLDAVAQDPGVLHNHAYIMFTASPQARRLTIGRLGTRILVPCVEKPFDIDDLLSEVERAVHRATRAAVAGAMETAAACEVCS
jgi:CheY-like chemotaxis protein